MRYCAVKGCNVHYYSGLSLHRCPKDPVRAKIWIERVKPNVKNTKYLFVCSRHFYKSQIISDYPKRRLAPGAIPSLNLSKTYNDPVSKIVRERTVCQCQFADIKKMTIEDQILAIKGLKVCHCKFDDDDNDDDDNDDDDDDDDDDDTKVEKTCASSRNNGAFRVVSWNKKISDQEIPVVDNKNYTKVVLEKTSASSSNNGGFRVVSPSEDVSEQEILVVDNKKYQKVVMENTCGSSNNEGAFRVVSLSENISGQETPAVDNKNNKEVVLAKTFASSSNKGVFRENLPDQEIPAVGNKNNKEVVLKKTSSSNKGALKIVSLSKKISGKESSDQEIPTNSYKRNYIAKNITGVGDVSKIKKKSRKKFSDTPAVSFNEGITEEEVKESNVAPIQKTILCKSQGADGLSYFEIDTSTKFITCSANDKNDSGVNSNEEGNNKEESKNENSGALAFATDDTNGFLNESVSDFEDEEHKDFDTIDLVNEMKLETSDNEEKLIDFDEYESKYPIVSTEDITNLFKKIEKNSKKKIGKNKKKVKENIEQTQWRPMIFKDPIIKDCHKDCTLPPPPIAETNDTFFENCEEMEFLDSINLPTDLNVINIPSSVCDSAFLKLSDVKSLDRNFLGKGINLNNKLVKSLLHCKKLTKGTTQLEPEYVSIQGERSLPIYLFSINIPHFGVVNYALTLAYHHRLGLIPISSNYFSLPYFKHKEQFKKHFSENLQNVNEESDKTNNVECGKYSPSDDQTTPRPESVPMIRHVKNARSTESNRNAEEMDDDLVKAMSLKDVSLSAVNVHDRQMKDLQQLDSQFVPVENIEVAEAIQLSSAVQESDLMKVMSLKEISLSVPPSSVALPQSEFQYQQPVTFDEYDEQILKAMENEEDGDSTEMDQSTSALEIIHLPLKHQKENSRRQTEQTSSAVDVDAILKNSKPVLEIRKLPLKNKELPGKELTSFSKEKPKKFRFIHTTNLDAELTQMRLGHESRRRSKKIRKKEVGIESSAMPGKETGENIELREELTDESESLSSSDGLSMDEPCKEPRILQRSKRKQDSLGILSGKEVGEFVVIKELGEMGTRKLKGLGEKELPDEHRESSTSPEGLVMAEQSKALESFKKTKRKQELLTLFLGKETGEVVVNKERGEFSYMHLKRKKGEAKLTITYLSKR